MSVVNPASYEAISNMQDNDLQPWIDLQSDERRETALRRALWSLDEYETPEFDTPLWWEMMERYYDQLFKMAMEDLHNGLCEQGMMIAHVNDEGMLVYNITALGELYLGQLFGDACESPS